MALNLEKQLRFYGAYHHDAINIGIHMVGVPIILWTTFLLFTNSGPLIKLPQSMTIPNLELDAGTLFCLSYCGLYILLEPVAGTAFAALLLSGTAYAHHLVAVHGMTANFWAAAAFVASWIAQFLGHGVFEGRAPALLDNIFQAFFLAPLFVWLEILFALGYRPELKSRVDKMVEQDIAKYRESKAQKANGQVNGTAANGHIKQS
ncbi:hypothetical protein AYO21_00265 [Fonsecaea monophora]|uniref:Unplaced genomic scaffold supercont1.2, whole genome shotgun sequence n=2 Tax=Fonsecaea TaxID=40354 RepID=A0A0D2F9I6_9EURO|nr:uncharacterized protein Z517_02552 [Fonsecaea pedrosoi CBS 271.37]XP_022517581.1 hypothetical protein AYO21_00265 [Fonsecaea monophora]KIW83307.1 hypothetical protein Z517_02552 [Fonsecaea pedrosoi CBS 271.37]OAG45629.1 hypothetical protein AYO21_00265 [Fonsecaea monophora]